MLYFFNEYCFILKYLKAGIVPPIPNDFPAKIIVKPKQVNAFVVIFDHLK